MAVAPTVRLSESGSVGSRKKKSISTMAIVLIVIVVAVVVVGLISIGLFFDRSSPIEVVGSGNLVTTQEFISDFTKVDAKGGFNVEIVKSGFYSVFVTADDNIMKYIEITKSGETLIVGVTGGVSFNSTTLKVDISMPELYSLELSEGVQCKLDEFSSTSQFSVDLSEGSVLIGEFVTTENVTLDLSGGTVLGLVGEANDITIDASSGSNLSISSFTVHNVNVKLSGGSIATIKLDGRLDADLSGGSKLLYIGDPTLGMIERSGGSEIIKSPLPD